MLNQHTSLTEQISRLCTLRSAVQYSDAGFLGGSLFQVVEQFAKLLRICRNICSKTKLSALSGTALIEAERRTDSADSNIVFSTFVGRIHKNGAFVNSYR